ncbi:MAG TPA: hypothetical protein VL651_02980, partial [Bacteroidia bacterium]|nr:hypothetical protein [Bacteroidia bacterium]
ADEQYPKDQIALCDANIKKAGADKSYNDAIAAADVKFKASDWTGAKTLYNNALSIKADEKYPKDQIAVCDANINAAGIDKQYNTLIAAADVLFKASKWSDAKAKYQEALGVKAGQQYPTDQIAACDAELTKLMSLDQQYDAAVKKGDSAFAANDYETAQTAFTNAKTLKPAETYPPKKLAEIASLIAGQKKENDYRKLIQKGDSLLAAKDLAGAKKIYQSALLQKPADEYPKKKITEIDNALSDQKFEADKKAKYDKLITQADTKFKAKDYKGAKALYQQALQIEPIEVYPKTQINACDDALNPKPVVKVDSTKIVGSDQYISEIVKNYPKGVTELPQVKDGGADVTKRVVVIGNKGWVYTKKVYSWGTFYFKDDQQITQQTFDYETNAQYVKKQNDTYDAAHPN